ncbi:MAG: translation initiation factor IF-2 [Verrucomicrobia bacterium]|nr:translation initiation factor IF-2 [Verrucomicrobiota bacterium]
MATRASSRKDSGTTKNKAAETTPAPSKPAAPKTATDLISPKKKAPATEPKPTRTGVPPISKIRPREATTPEPAAPAPAPDAAATAASAGGAGAGSASPAPAAAAVPPPATNLPARPESVSLIDEKPERKSSTGTGEGRRVLPPISRIRIPQIAPKPAAKPPEPPPPVMTPAPPAAPAVPAPNAEGEKVIHIKPPIIVRDLAQQIGLKPFQLIHDLMEMNIFAAINHTVEPDVAAAICRKHGFVFEVEKREKGAGVHKVEAVVEEPPPPVIEKEEELQPRAPIITFMGHVDHGKTSLMDAIRKSRVAASEAGGITQHIGAYSVVHKGQKITFLDTPGHEAFTAMRARGANVTDIVVLVVAADDGLMPQTIEAINHARAAKVPMIVALNKIDLPSANVDRAKAQLQERGLTPEDWGGETICCPVSATKGIGLDHLLEMMLLQAEIMELKASPTVPPRATVIEAQLEAGRGPTATLIVRMGTVKVGQAFICGNFWGKVKSLIDDSGKSIKEAGPSTPLKVLGFTGLPNAGDELLVMESERAARVLSEERLAEQRTQKLAMPQRATLESLFDSMSDERKVLQLILKCDVQGSAEAITMALNQIESKKIDLEIIHVGIGPITESDVLLATASNAVIVGFNIKVENQAAAAAKREGVQIKLFSIIYELIDQIKEAMVGMLDPEVRESVVGHAEVRQIFELSKGTVAGCYVSDGRIVRTARARVLRRRQPIYDGGIATLRRFQDDVKEVRAGVECGIKLGDFSEYEVGDVIECYNLEKIAQQL